MSEDRVLGKRSFPWGAIYIAFTIVCVVAFGFWDNQYENIFKIISQLVPVHIFIAMVTVAIYLAFEGIVTYILMRGQKIFLPLRKMIKIGIVGVYYAYITPGASGGQPMQVVYLGRDKIPVGKSSAVLIMKFISYQCAFFICSLIMFISMHGKIVEKNPVIIPFVILGLVINGMSIVFFLSLFFAPVLKTVCGFAKWIIARIRFWKKRESFFEKIDKFQSDFISYTHDFEKKKKRILLSIVISFPQFIIQMSTLGFIYMSFGYTKIPFAEILMMQSLLQVSASFMPTPGAAGAQEIGFAAFFEPYFVHGDLFAAMVVWRFFTFYMVLIIGAVSVIIDQVIYNKKIFK